IEKIINIDLSLLEDIEVETEVEEDLLPKPTLKQGSLFEEPAKQYTLRSYRKDKTATLIKLGEALQSNPDSLFKNERSKIVNQLADQYKFFHNQLEFIEVFIERGGFDVIVGNPPWISVSMNELGVFSEKNPECLIRKMSAAEVRKLINNSLPTDTNLKDNYIYESMWAESTKVFIGAYQNYPLLHSQKNNLFKCFVTAAFNNISNKGYVGMIHPEGYYEDNKAGKLRKEAYHRLKFHFQFVNTLNLFAEIEHWNTFSINIYGDINTEINFASISNLFHPITIDGCFLKKSPHLVGGIKLKNELSGKFEWNIKPHPDRCIEIDFEKLKILAAVFDDVKDCKTTKLVPIHSKQILSILEKTSKSKSKVGDYSPEVTIGFDEAQVVKSGLFKKETSYIEDPNNETLIISGPHFFVSQPIYKTPRSNCKNPLDYDVINLELIPENFIPRTNYKQLKEFTEYYSEGKVKSLTKWINNYKVCLSRMLIFSGERTLQSSLYYPGIAHINSINSVSFVRSKNLLEFLGLTSSLVHDFFIKTLGVSNLKDNVMRELPMGIPNKILSKLISRTLLLNCLNENYKTIWSENWEEKMIEDFWSKEDPRLQKFKKIKKEWSFDYPLKSYYERRQALIEIDVLSAMGLEISIDELISMYNVQFPVLQQNEDDTWYDTKGNIVFTCSKGLTGVGVDRPVWRDIKDLKAGETYEHTIEKSELYYGKKVTYHAPFDKCDRVEDYKVAWAHFEKVFKD
ncbi:MAG: type II restriction endonuclease subunit M, partial [Acidimicrobiia bacterium]|nr:type II restriction endonuclease subunit M [Acidimicrobiia bacterium]